MAKFKKGGSMGGTLSEPYHPKAKPLQATRPTSRGLTGITPTGMTGHANTTKEGMDGRVKGGMPKMRAGGTSKGHKVPISFNFPSMRSATVPHNMGGLGAQPGGNVGVNPPFKEGKVAGKKAKNQRSMKGY